MMTTEQLRARLADSLAPLCCLFEEPPDRAGALRFRLRDGVGRLTETFALTPREVKEDAHFDAAISRIMLVVERDGFRHRR